MGSLSGRAWQCEGAPGGFIDYGVISGKVDLIEAVFNTSDDSRDRSSQIIAPETHRRVDQPFLSACEELSQRRSVFPEKRKNLRAETAELKAMMYRAAALRPLSVEAPAVAERTTKRRNVRISSDPQTVAARQRRERISDRLRVLRRLVPGGSKMDTASMLDEAASYLKFLKAQVIALQGGEPSSSSSSSASSSSSSPRSPASQVFTVHASAAGNPGHLRFSYGGWGSPNIG